MANYIATDTDLEAVADAIRTKGGTSTQLEFPSGFVGAIDAISGGGVLGVTQDEDGYLVLSPVSSGGGDPIVVPSGYTQLAYIETDGHSCIDTGITWGANKRIEFSWAQDGGVSFAQFASPFGSGVCFVQFKGTNFCSPANIKINDSNYVAGTEGIPMTPNTMTVTPNLITAGAYGNAYMPAASIVSQSGTVTNDGNTFVIGARHGASAIERFLVGTIIYRWRMYDNDTLIQDLVPAMRDSDDVIGMYDIVNNEFLTNAGSGSFTGGAL